ncbi:hypothetical protein BZG36_04361 [Bifiguratus adelaidae]|uniref:DUF292-domain-containing protein n=1 Tax=Bifiguratus adelaidae TaxID=1938954 RepID=A0A261XVS5_9FUNG|nr:hypothetical protein BZG36_04361 [Bifiguratus adelaidae]
MVFNPTRLKVQLKLAINRLKMLQSKKASLAQHQRREIAHLLEIGKEESARIRVEHIIREDLMSEAMEILELYCDLLLARFGLLEQLKNCDPGIAEAVNTIIYAAPRAEQVKELTAVRDQLVSKYGKDFTLAAMDNVDGVVNPRIVSKLRVETPDAFLVDCYLEEIAKTYHVKWRANGEADEDLASDDGADGGIGEQEADISEKPIKAALLAEPASLQPASPTPPPTKSQESMDLPSIPADKPRRKSRPAGSVPPPPGSLDSTNDKEPLPDFDELTKRFEALKKRK